MCRRSCPRSSTSGEGLVVLVEQPGPFLQSTLSACRSETRGLLPVTCSSLSGSSRVKEVVLDCAL